MLPYDLPPDYPERIKALRGRLSLTQSRLAKLLGVDTATISRWESGQLQPALPLWHRLAEAEEHGGELLEGQSDLEELLALMRDWRSAPDDGEDQTAIVAELDRALEEDPLRLRRPDLADF